MRKTPTITFVFTFHTSLKRKAIYILYITQSLQFTIRFQTTSIKPLDRNFLMRIEIYYFSLPSELEPYSVTVFKAMLAGINMHESQFQVVPFRRMMR